MRTTTIETAGIRLQLHEWGAPDAPPVLFWHALADHTGLQVMEAATILTGECGLRVIAVDAPGFGGSEALAEPEDYVLPRLADFTLQLLDTLGLEQTTWLGPSWGAAVGAAVAAAHPDRISALVLLDGGYHDPSRPHQTLEELRAYWLEQPGFRYAGWDELFAEAEEYFGRWSPALQASTRSAFREEGGEVVSRMGPSLYATVIWAMQDPPQSAAWPGLAAGGVPVLLLAASEPPPTPEVREAALEAFRATVSHAEVCVLEGRPHHLLEAQPEETAQLVADWLRSL